MKLLRVLLVMLALGAVALSQAPASPEPSPNVEKSGDCPATSDLPALVQRVAENERANYLKAANYMYTQRAETRELDGNSRVKKTSTRTSEIMFIYGERVERLIAIDDKPVSEKERAKQEEKIDKLIRERENESEQQKQKRLADFEKRRSDERQFVSDVANAYNFTLLPDETIDGREMLVLDAVPKRDYVPKAKIKPEGLLRKVRFRGWVDKADCQWTKLKIESLDTISFGGFVARIGRGTRIAIEQTRVNDELWLPRSVAIKVGGRILLLKKFNLEQDITYSEYRKFRADTKILSIGEVEQH